jgi:predicted nucleic acid-binding protein
VPTSPAIWATSSDFRALEIYVTYPSLSFVDALLAVYAEESPPSTVISFDEGFDRIPGITRAAP